MCYAENGQEYIRYHRGYGTYRYPDLAEIPMIGEQGLFGQTSSPAMTGGPIPLSARMGGLSMGEFVPRKHYETSHLASSHTILKLRIRAHKDNIRSISPGDYRVAVRCSV